MASLVGLAPTRAGLKDRTLDCFAFSDMKMGCLTGSAPVRPPSQGGMLLLHHRHHWNGKSGTSAWSRTKLALRNRQAAHSVRSLVKIGRDDR